MELNIAFKKTGSSSNIVDFSPEDKGRYCKIWTKNGKLEPKYATDGLTAI